MSLIRSPMDVFLHHVLDRFDDVLVPSYSSSHLYPTEDGYAYEVPIPGMTRENVKIQLDEHTMYIKAQTEKKNKYSQIASNYQYVQSLPKDVDMDTISAVVEHGVLTISMKKIQKQRSVKDIPIR